MRRFFDIDDLAGVRFEDREVFQATHAKVIEFAREGLVEGIRVARLDGAAPIPASSGQTIRYRLDRSGDRKLNRTLHQIIVTRRRWHHPTIDYVNRRVQEGKTKREATRCLKRYLCRLMERSAPTTT